MAEIHPRLGARRAPDPNDRRYPMEGFAPERSERTFRYWPGHRYVLDQGTQPQCVAYSWTHLIVDSPLSHRMDGLEVLHRKAGGAGPAYAVKELYDLAQQLDEFPETPPEGGSSVRAGAKALAQLGLVKEYRWVDCSNAEAALETIVNTILEVGPVIVGVPWYSGMFHPGSDGEFQAPFMGSVQGYHATKLDGVNAYTERLRHKNSWGRTWGQGGYSHWPFDMLLRLLGEDAECCYAVLEGE